MNWLWAAFNGAFDTVTLILVLTSFIPILNFITGLILAFYCGSSGNERAWRAKRWKSVEHFKSTQLLWANIGFVIWGAVIFLGIVWIVALNQSSSYGRRFR